MTGRPRRPGRKPATPRLPSAPRQPAPPQPATRQAVAPARPPSYVVVLWQAPELTERNPPPPMSLHQALQAGRPYDPGYPIPGLPAPGSQAQPDREAEL